MKIIVAGLISVAIILVLAPAISSATQQQPTLQQTPFGVREVPPAPGTPQPPATPPPAAPAAPQQPPQQAPAQPSPQQAGDDVANISLTMDNADIYGVIKIIADTLNLNYIIDPGIKGTVNIHTSGTLRRTDLLPLLETLLKINGATMVKLGNFYQILPTPSAIRQPLAVQEANQAAPDDQIVIQVIRMKFVAASEMVRLLTPYLSEGANIVNYDSGNILLLSERRSNLRKLLELIDVFDTKAFEGDRVRLIPVRKNLVRDLIADLRNVFAGYGLSETASAVKFVAMDRLNSILVISGNPVIFTEVERWIDRLDQPIETAGIRSYVYKLRNAKASELQRVLSNLYSGVPQAPVYSATPAGQTALPPAPTPFTPPAPGVPQTGLGVSGVRIIADDVTNSLIVQATPQQWADIERTLVQLDILPRQVLIDAQIYEVSLSDSLAISLSAILQNRGTLKNPQTTASFVGNGGPPSLAVQTFGFVGRTRELVAFLNASENRSRVRTLSAPSILVKDNMVADFTVGADIPIPTTSAVAAGVQANGNSVFTQTIAFRSVGVILRVKPQINDSGALTLEVAQEISQASANTTSTIAAPEIGRSAVNSTIVVQDNETIAIGGFIRENKELTRNRVPLLGRIPGVGVLFGDTSNSTSRTELIVLITPHVLRTREDLDASTEELKSKLYEVQKLLK